MTIDPNSGNHVECPCGWRAGATFHDLLDHAREQHGRVPGAVPVTTDHVHATSQSLKPRQSSCRTCGRIRGRGPLNSGYCVDCSPNKRGRKPLGMAS